MATRTSIVGAHVQNATLSSAQTLTKPANASGALISCTGQNCRYTVDGATAPTASTGFQLVKDGVPLYVECGASLKVIEMAASASLSVQWVFTEEEHRR
jgi:hypothetical protein